MKSTWKKLLSIIMVLCMLVTIVPVTVLAVDAEPVVDDADIVSAAPLSDNEAAEDFPEDARWSSVEGGYWQNPLYPDQGKPAVKYNAGEPIQGELYIEDFMTREAAIKELRNALIERKNEIYLYYKTGALLSEEDCFALMEEAITTAEYHSNYNNCDYLMMSVLDFAMGAEYILQDGTYYNVVVFAVDYLTTAEQEQELREKVESLRETVYNVGENDYQIIKAIYDYICNNVEYETENLDSLLPYSAYGALINGKASAQGYAMLFYYMTHYFMTHTEYQPTRIILGTLADTDVVSAWNIVQIYDKWYNLDVAVDAFGDTYDYFLKGSSDFTEHTRVEYYDTAEFHAAHPMAEVGFDSEKSVYGDIGNGLHWNYSAGTNTVSISGTGAMPDFELVTDSNFYTYAQVPWKDYMWLTDVRIEDGVTAVGANAFYNQSVVEISFADSVVKIGEGAFAHCSVESLTLPKGLQEIGKSAFAYNVMERVDFPEGLLVIGEEAFDECTKVKEITLPNSLTTIGAGAFMENALTEVKIPSGVTEIGRDAFYMTELDNVENEAAPFMSYTVDAANTVYSSADGLLLSKDRTKLVAVPGGRAESFTVPDYVTTIGEGAFSSCNKLTEVIIPATVTAIEDEAFLGCAKLNTVALPDGIASIGERAFAECSALASVVLPASLGEISSGLFRDSGLQAVAVPESVVSIGDHAFSGTPMGSIAIPTSVKSIGDGAFMDCGVRKDHGYFKKTFTDVYYNGTQEQWNAIAVGADNEDFVNASLHLNEWALSGAMIQAIPWKVDLNTGAMSLNMSETTFLTMYVTETGYPWHAWRDVVRTVSMDANTTGPIDIGNAMLKDCINLTSVTFGVGVGDASYIKINAEAFAGCTALTSMNLPAPVNRIASNAFSGCTALKTISFPKTIYSIDESAFEGCTALTDVYVDQTEKEWQGEEYTSGDERAHAFTKLPNVNFHYATVVVNGVCGDNLTWTFNKDSGVLTISGEGPMIDFAEGEARPWDLWTKEYTTAIVVEEGITSIGARAFKNYDGEWFVKGISIPSTVVSIGEEAFYRCYLSGKFVLNDGVKYIGKSAFENLSVLQNTLILPDGLITLDEKAFYNSSYMTVYVPDSVKNIGDYALSWWNIRDLYYEGSEEQWNQISIGEVQHNLAYVSFHYNSGCPHIEGPIPGVEATCTETGLSEGQQCLVCGVVTQKQEVVSRNAHNIVDAACTVCGKTYDLTQPVSGTCGDGLEWSFDLSGGFLYINGSGAMDSYTAQEPAPWHYWREEIFAVFLSDNLTSIGDYAFAGCINLRNLTIPKAVKNIGDAVCADCESLTEVNYSGTMSKWKEITIGADNEVFSGAKLHCEPSVTFSDVSSADYFYAPVGWAVDNNITGGIGNNMFGPNNGCTRGQVVTFLWAAAGRPEPASLNNPFNDVSETDYFYKAVLWAVENGITGGIGEGLFGPNETCTRGQIVTFLWASQGKPAVSGGSSFTDVADTDWYAKPVVWAAENDVTGGIGNGQFGPNNTCTRGQVVTFLYKVYG